jgi:hypothetical protein
MIHYMISIRGAVISILPAELIVYTPALIVVTLEADVIVISR